MARDRPDPQGSYLRNQDHAGPILVGPRCCLRPGYSDMAMGLVGMPNVRFTREPEHPYKEPDATGNMRPGSLERRDPTSEASSVRRWEYRSLARLRP
jgi:hypothetical protein